MVQAGPWEVSRLRVYGRSGSIPTVYACVVLSAVVRRGIQRNNYLIYSYHLHLYHYGPRRLRSGD